jgi:circadian clock protein KaiC
MVKKVKKKKVSSPKKKIVSKKKVIKTKATPKKKSIKSKKVLIKEEDVKNPTKDPKVNKKKIKSLFDLNIKKGQPQKKKKAPKERVKTGIPGLDPLMGGGFKYGSINLVEGGPGTGKTIFATQFLLEGLKRGEPVAYITFEVIKEKFYENMKILGWDLQKYEDKGLFHFLAYTPEQIKKILLEGGGTIDTLVHQKKIKRIVIDSITSFALLYANELAKKEAALTLFNVINTWDCTALLTAQEEGDVAHGEVVSAALDFEVDGILVIYYMKKKGIRKRGVELLKMRGTKTPDKVFNMEISNKGISVKKTKYTI